MKLDELKYPGIYAFHIQRNVVTGEQAIRVTYQGKPGKPDNKHWAGLKRFSYNPNHRYAVVEVELIKNPEQMLDRMQSLDKAWGVEPNEKEAGSIPGISGDGDERHQAEEKAAEV